jgi:16S rRNA (cytosine1402-N4)-methyltransferase
MAKAAHVPVMLPDVLQALAPADGQTYADGTLGAGGYTRAILDAANCNVVAIDRDRTAIDAASAWRGKYGKRLILVHGRFGDARALVAQVGFEQLDGFVLDIGVSSMQLDQAERGFSFRFDGPLDMRMDGTQGETAADIVNEREEKDLADLIYLYGQERHSRRVARAIVRARAENKIVRTLQLADIVRGAVPGGKKSPIDPATRTFQALRIAVNDELGELKRALIAAEQLLRAGGRLVVVTFHSLEDGIVKHFMQERAGRKSAGSRHLPGAAQATHPDPTFTLPSSKAIAASDTESAANPRARSAKMRVAVRTEAQAWGAA